MKQQTSQLAPIWRDFRGPLDNELRSIVGDSSLPLYSMMRYHLGWVDEQGKPQQPGGKGLRPLLCLLACEAAGGDWRRALPAAAAVELAHNFSLIHDDIQDCSAERRNRPTVWSVWGAAQAINAGDSMHTLARLAMLRLSSGGVPLVAVLEATILLDEACLKLCEGQYLDISYEKRLDVSVDDYLNMVRLKTAALFECSVGVGAVVGSGDASKRQRLRRFGEALGMAFQVQDDILGIWGEKGKVGKPVTGDIKQKKKSLPVVYGLQNADIGDRLAAIYSGGEITPADVAEVEQLLVRVGARQYAEKMAGDFYKQAAAELLRVPMPDSSRSRLRVVADSLLGRSR
ncbi:MAG: polyprenyl synthetase family protein [Dehalococcoidia bacterium]|nr:polyprenyl synthetase family protein [Dehalococcoidia bacterium]